MSCSEPINQYSVSKLSQILDYGLNNSLSSENYRYYVGHQHVIGRAETGYMLIFIQFPLTQWSPLASHLLKLFQTHLNISFAYAPSNYAGVLASCTNIWILPPSALYTRACISSQVLTIGPFSWAILWTNELSKSFGTCTCPASHFWIHGDTQQLKQKTLPT
jgi:hypothetical protein